MNEVYVAGVSMTRFGKQLNRSTKELATEALHGALADAGATQRQIQAVFYGNCVQGHMEGQDMVRGEISLMFADYPSALPHVRSGAIRAIAVTTTERSALLPDIPSMKEVGLPEFDMHSWNGIFAPAGTPAPIIARLNGELRAIIADPAVYARLKEFGFDAFTSTPEELGSFVKEELVKWGRWTREAGLQPE